MDLSIPSLASLELAGKRVLVRVDFNVPKDESGAIADDTRIVKALPTVRAILAAGGRPILLSHLGRPKSGPEPKFSLAPVAQRLAEHLGDGHPVSFCGESQGPAAAAAVEALPAGGVLVCENVRYNSGETKGDAGLAEGYAALADVFVNDAFGSSHRNHASVCGPAAHLPSAGGLLLEAEIAAFARVLGEPARPLVAILGGAKVSDKLQVIDSLLDRVDRLLIGGGMAYTFLAAAGGKIGASLVQEDQFDLVRSAVRKAESKGVQLLLPSDHVVGEAFDRDTAPKVVTGDIEDGWMGLDIGPDSQAAYAKALSDAQTVLSLIHI